MTDTPFLRKAEISRFTRNETRMGGWAVDSEKMRRRCKEETTLFSE